MSKRDEMNAAFAGMIEADRVRKLQEQQNADLYELEGRQEDAYNRPTFRADFRASDAARRQALASGKSLDEAVSLAETVAAGDPNSAAQQQLQRGITQGQQNATTAASVTRGGELARVASQRAAINAGSNMAAQGVGASASLLAKETAAGRQDFASLSDARRGLAQSTLGFDQERAIRDRAAQAAQEERRREFGRALGGAETATIGTVEQNRAATSSNTFEANRQADARRAERRRQDLQNVSDVTSVVAPPVGILSNSDERAKRPDRLAEAAAMRGRR